MPPHQRSDGLSPGASTEHSSAKCNQLLATIALRMLAETYRRVFSRKEWMEPT
jgi:hypothetical protein